MPWSSSTTPALTDTEGNLVSSLEDKEKIVRKGAFPPSTCDPEDPPLHRDRSAHQKVDKATVGRTLFYQAHSKAP